MRFCSFNVENLFLSTSPYSFPHKNTDKVKWLAEVIREIDAEIYFLIEVGGEESLKEFNDVYLNNEYVVSLIKGNSSRGIEIGYLIKKGSLHTFEHLTHRNRTLGFLYSHEKQENKRLIKEGKKPKHNSHYLSRDIAELRVYGKGKDIPKCIFLGVHLKSKLNDTGHDWLGKERRASELSLLIETYKALNKKFNKTVPIFLTGDFNGTAAGDDLEDEFKKIYSDTTLQDVSEHLEWTADQKTTFILYDKSKSPIQMQLDYFFLETSMKDLIDVNETCVYRFKRENLLPLPQTPFARAALPSDHYPIVIKLLF
jgi:hypothetical protein